MNQAAEREAPRPGFFGGGERTREMSGVAHHPPRGENDFGLFGDLDDPGPGRLAFGQRDPQDPRLGVGADTVPVDFGSDPE